MKEIYNYIDKYGNRTFNEIGITEIDIVIFSQIVYLSFGNLIPSNEEKVTLNKALKGYYKNINKYDIKNVVNLGKTLIDKKRYKDLLLSNYSYKLTDDEQFGALCIDIDSNRYVAFEGTDTTVTGWLEDFALSYKFPIPAQTDAIKYLNKVSKGANNITVLGHSKGGNLALVSSMYTSIFTRYKIKKVYSFDGPGLLEQEYNSFRYKLIKKKYIKYVPRYTVVGKLFEDTDNEIVIDSNDKGFKAHSIFKWKIEDTKLKRSEISNFSIKFDKVFTNWVNNYSSEERKFFSDYIENFCKNNNIEHISDIVKMEKTRYIKLLRKSKHMDPKFKKMLKEFVYFAKEYFITDPKNALFKKIGLIKESINEAR